MGVAAAHIASLPHMRRRIGYNGQAVMLYVARPMVWDGHRNAVIKLDRTDAYKAAIRGPMDISPDEAARHRLHSSRVLGRDAAPRPRHVRTPEDGGL